MKHDSNQHPLTTGSPISCSSSNAKPSSVSSTDSTKKPSCVPSATRDPSSDQNTDYASAPHTVDTVAVTSIFFTTSPDCHE